MNGATAFVYGTLLADEVVKTLIKRVPASKPATLHGFRRHSLKGQVYPAIVPSAPHSVQGKVLMGLTPSEINILDVYEADEYYRTTVEPVLEDSTKIVADVYVWKPEFNEMLLPEDWNYDTWRQDKLHLWVEELQPDAAHPNGELAA